MQTQTVAQTPSRFREERGALLKAFAKGLRPQPVVSPAAWGRDHFIVPVGPAKGQRLDLTLTPYVHEPLEQLRADSPHTEIAVKKSAQTGFSTLGLVWIFTLIDTATDDMMIVQPTITAARDFNEERLDPAIKATPAIRRKTSTARATRWPCSMRGKSPSRARAAIRSSSSRRRPLKVPRGSTGPTRLAISANG